MSTLYDININNGEMRLRLRKIIADLSCPQLDGLFRSHNRDNDGHGRASRAVFSGVRGVFRALYCVPGFPRGKTPPPSRRVRVSHVHGKSASRFNRRRCRGRFIDGRRVPVVVPPRR